jgi:hypothetical protein
MSVLTEMGAGLLLMPGLFTSLAAPRSVDAAAGIEVTGRLRGVRGRGIFDALRVAGQDAGHESGQVFE